MSVRYLPRMPDQGIEVSHGRNCFPMIIETSHLTKRFGAQTAVSDLDLQVETGDFVGLLGPNGAGKTTTIRMLSALLSPTSGRISISGFDPQIRPGQVKQFIGVVCESYGFYGWMSGEQYLSFFADLYGVRDKAKRVRELLALVGLQTAGDKPLATYSRGMQQRLGIARAILHKPRVLMLDEPTLGLDPEGQKEVHRLLVDLNRGGTTILLSSHSLDEVERLVKRIAVLNRGKLIAQGTMDEMRRRLTSNIRIHLTVSDPARALALTSQAPGVRRAEMEGNRVVLFASSLTEIDTSGLARTLFEQGIAIHELVSVKPDLEDIFFELTQTERIAA